MTPYGDVTVLVRSTGERTEQACVELLQGLFPGHEIGVVRASPHPAALREVYLRGIQEGRPWTLCLDADVLVSEPALEVLLRRRLELEDETFEIEGRVLDKLLAGPRPAGNHLYRTGLLPRALELIPEEPDRRRPETATLRRMHKLGYRWLQFPEVIGLHDFEQYYRDVFRKMVHHLRKHEPYIPDLVPFYRRASAWDGDYRLVLRTVLEPPPPSFDALDASTYPPCAPGEPTEKAPLRPREIRPDHVSATLRGFKVPREFRWKPSGVLARWRLGLGRLMARLAGRRKRLTHRR